MIKIENAEVLGWKAAIRGMRNPLNSWDKSDTLFIEAKYCDEMSDFDLAKICGGRAPIIKENDLDLMKRLSKAGTDHRKYLRMITVYVDLTAPLYWWKEFDTYKVGTVANSCSTMHKIQAKPFVREDFSCERLTDDAMAVMDSIIAYLEEERSKFVDTKDKSHWHNMIQLLPSSFNQMRTVTMNYEVLINIYYARRNHKLAEWHTLCEVIEGLPYAKELILVKREDNE